MLVRVKIYDKSKYEADSVKVAEEEFEISGFHVATGDEATKIGEQTDRNSRDEHNEYLVLEFGDGETCTFCNSHVDLFSGPRIIRTEVTIEIGDGEHLEATIKSWPEMNAFARDWKTEYLGNVMDWNSKNNTTYAHFKDACNRHYLVEI